MGTGRLSQPAAPTYGDTGWEAVAGAPQRGRYLVKSVTGAQLLPSGKQKRGMACRRRSSSSFWPLRRFSRWNKVMPRVRATQGAHSPGVLLGAGGDLLAPASPGQTEAEGACTSLGKHLPKVPTSAGFTPWILGRSAGTQVQAPVCTLQTSENSYFSPKGGLNTFGNWYAILGS